MSKRPATGVWEVDQTTGRRFRRIGQGCIEWEKIVYVDGFPVPESELEDFCARRKEAEEQEKKLERQPEPDMPVCPFHDRMTMRCKGSSCALYADGCTLARIFKGKAARATKGLSCPLNECWTPCRGDCALYDDGCKLTSHEREE